MKNLKKVLLSGILSCMMVSAATAMTAYADYVINVEDITGKIESEDFKQLLLTYVSDGEVYSCSEAELRAADISQAFQIPDIDDEGNANYGNRIMKLINGIRPFVCFTGNLMSGQQAFVWKRGKL